MLVVTRKEADAIMRVPLAERTDEQVAKLRLWFDIESEKEVDQ